MSPKDLKELPHLGKRKILSKQTENSNGLENHTHYNERNL